MNAIEEFGAYRKAVELFDHVVEDVAGLREEFSLGRLISQQIASADSLHEDPVAYETSLPPSTPDTRPSSFPLDPRHSTLS